MHFVTTKMEISTWPITDVAIVILGFYVFKFSEVDHVMAETCSRNLVRGKRFFSVPKRQDWLRIPPNLLLNRC